MRLSNLTNAPLAVAHWLGWHSPESPEAAGRILLYHGTPATDIEQFERQLRYLRRSFALVTLDALIEAQRKKSTRSGRMLALTFDDGLRNNVTRAYPVLASLKIPATFFVCPGVIETGGWLWNVEARERLRTLKPSERAGIAAGIRAPDDIETIIARMKMMSFEDRRDAEESIRHSSREFSPSASQAEAFDLAGWDELRSLDPSLITIGSHGMTHSILTCCTDDQLERELADSRRIIESELKRTVTHLAYPNGDHDGRVQTAAARHYTAAYTTQERWLDGANPALRLPRVSAPEGVLRLARNMHLTQYQPCVS